MLLTYAWSAFPETPALPGSPTVDLLGNAIFAVGAVLLIASAALIIRHRDAGSHPNHGAPLALGARG